MSSYLDKYLDDLYKLKINLNEISKLENVGRSKVGKDLKSKGLESPWVWYGKIDTGIRELDEVLKQRYNSIVTRCNGNNNNKHHSKVYKGLDYMYIFEWVDYCNENKELLKQMWSNFINSGKDRRLSISVDRKDDSEGYTIDNTQFVTHGFNAWKRNVRPIAVTRESKVNYFMSGEEASNYYGIRKQTIGDILRGQKRLLAKEYFPENSKIKDVLLNNNVKSLEEYYERFILDLATC